MNFCQAFFRDLNGYFVSDDRYRFDVISNFLRT